jgi:phosphatidylglycerophosphatase A
MTYLTTDHCRQLVTLWGVGDRRPAPGTLGSLVALPIGWLILLVVGWKGLGILALAVFFLGWFGVTKARDRFAEVDAPQIVIDEVAGQWLSLLVIDPTRPIEVLLAFLFFRYFDWDKPWPASWVQKKLVSPLGVMLDDVIAAGFACLFLMAAIPLAERYVFGY